MATPIHPHGPLIYSKTTRKAARDILDRTYRQALSNVKILERVLKSIDPTLLDKLDLSKAYTANTEFSGAAWLQKRFMDELWIIPWREPGKEPIVIAILIEQQSKPDALMPLRLLIYMVRFWERQWRKWSHEPRPRPKLKLYGFIPIVLSTGNFNWKAPKSLRKIIKTAESLVNFVPEFDTLYWELKHHKIEELRESDDEWLKTMAVGRAAFRTKSETFLPIFQETVESIVNSAELDSKSQEDLLELVLGIAAAKRSDSDHEECESMVETAVAKREALKTMMDIRMDSYAARLVQEGFDKGELKKSREWIKLALSKKFPSDPRLNEIFVTIEKCQDIGKLDAAWVTTLDLTSLDQFSLN